ncbi:ABC-1 domain protein, partial [mine drainage metagenome]
MPEATIKIGIRDELHVILKLYPVFRRYTRDRARVKKDEEKAWDPRIEANGHKAVQAFIELGPTFIKLGQVISARPDLLPNEYIKSFEQLQDNVPPAPFTEVKPTIEKNLGKIGDVFDSFNENAISGASLGQVYIARYHDEDVVVKVNRPNIQ